MNAAAQAVNLLMSNGRKSIPTVARVAALDVLLDEIGTNLTPGEADAAINAAATLFERDDNAAAMSRLMLACDLTGAYRLASVLFVETVQSAQAVTR